MRKAKHDVAAARKATPSAAPEWRSYAENGTHAYLKEPALFAFKGEIRSARVIAKQRTKN